MKYNLHPLTTLQATQVAAHTVVTHTSDLWHGRLGHTSSSILHKVASSDGFSINTTSSQLCTSCQLGKHNRLPFYHSERVTTEPLHLIHCDIWGPSPVASSLGFRYYVLFIDEFFRFHWIYPLKTRDESVDCFKHFKNMSENLLIKKIKLFQCDGAFELVKGKFQDFLAECGIIYRVSCHHLHQQNGLAERKHRHVNEVGNTLAFQDFLPKHFWYDSFLTAAYIINRLPTKILVYKSPFQMLFNTLPDYHFLRTFG